jgi:cell division transport system ATP-binding protein
LIFGLERADSGQILVLGQNLVKLREEALPYFRRSIGYVFQDIRLLPRRTVFENVGLAMKVTGASPGDIQKRTREVLEAVGLDHKQELFPSMLSAGEQQRVCIARAIVHHPPILLADEPTGDLDAEQAREIFRLLREINTMGATVVLATHHPEWTERAKGRIIKIQKGTTQADGAE